MTSTMMPHGLADSIRQLYRSDPSRAASAIETYVADTLSEISEKEKIVCLNALTAEFNPAATISARKSGVEETVFAEIVSLLLGRQVSNEKLTSQEIIERLSESLNTVFGTLNRLIQNINATLLGDAPDNQTIRQVIGNRLADEEEQTSLEEYLGRIDKAFYISHQAFRQAAHTLMLKILHEMDPITIAAKTDGGLKFGPLKKAEYFEIYEAKYETLKKWFESGRFMEDLLREFENNCQK